MTDECDECDHCFCALCCFTSYRSWNVAASLCSFSSFAHTVFWSQSRSPFTHISHLPCVLPSRQICVFSVQEKLIGVHLHCFCKAWGCAQTLIRNPRVPHSCLSQSTAMCQQYKSGLTLTFVILHSRVFWDVGLCVEGNCSTTICSVCMWYLTIFSSKQIVEFTGNQVVIHCWNTFSNPSLCGVFKTSKSVQNIDLFAS